MFLINLKSVLYKLNDLVRDYGNFQEVNSFCKCFNRNRKSLLFFRIALQNIFVI